MYLATGLSLNLPFGLAFTGGRAALQVWLAGSNTSMGQSMDVSPPNAFSEKLINALRESAPHLLSIMFREQASHVVCEQQMVSRRSSIVVLFPIMSTAAR